MHGWYTVDVPTMWKLLGAHCSPVPIQRSAQVMLLLRPASEESLYLPIAMVYWGSGSQRGMELDI